MSLPADASAATVAVEWGGQLELEVTGADGTKTASVVASTSSYDSGDEGSGGWSGSSSGSWDESLALLPQWQGKELRFMQSNEHSR